MLFVLLFSSHRTVLELESLKTQFKINKKYQIAIITTAKTNHCH